jgi:uncharacterized lipoprotein YmbA
MKSVFHQSLPAAPCSLLLALGALLLSGCNVLPEPQADTVRYFTLGSAAPATAAAGSLVVRPVKLAGHLHGRNMVVRVAEHEVIYLDDVHWAAPLDSALTQLLRTRLATVSGSGTVTVEVQRFELVRSEGNSVQLVASYMLVPAGGDKGTAPTHSFRASARSWDGKDTGTLVGLLADAANELGDAIAATAGAEPGLK